MLQKIPIALAQVKENWFLMPPHLLDNFEIQKYFQNEPRVNGIYSRDNLPKIKDGAYVIHLVINLYWKSFDGFVRMK